MEEKKTKEEKPETLPAEVRAVMLSGETSVYFNVALFEQVQRVASMFAGSTMIPEHFRNNVGNCVIALNYAHRIRADEFMVFQNLYEVHGTPGIQGKLVEAIINQSGKYSEPLDYEWLDPEDKIVSRREVLKAKVPSEYGCQAVSVDAKSGKRVIGPKITWELIKTRGWYDRKGLDGTIESNNWRTMAEMMFYYRAAAWFANKNCPEKTLGMPTVEELQDVVDLTPHRNGSYAMTDTAADLNEKLKADEKKKPTGDIYKTENHDASATGLKPGGPITVASPAEMDKIGDASEKEDPIRKLYHGLGDKKFMEFVESHKSAIPGMDKLYRDEIEASWIIRAKKKDGLLEGKPYPLDEPKEEAPIPEPPVKEPDKPGPKMMLNCPLSYDDRPEKNDEDRINVDVCDNICEGRRKCVAYSKYTANING